MQVKALNFNWDFKIYQKGDENGFEGERIDLPHNATVIPKQYFDETVTHNVFSYGKKLDLKIDSEARYFLRFEGVMSKADVSLNQKRIGKHLGGYTTFEFEITKELIDGENYLYVKVDSNPTADHPPFGHVVDYLTYGGIYREVSLIKRSKNYLHQILIDGDQAMLNVRMNLETKDIINHQIRFEVWDQDQKLHYFEKDVKDKTDIGFSEPHNLELWTLEHPKLYQAKLFLDGTLQALLRFGVRTIHIDQNNFYLNNEPVFLRGLNRHQSYPYVGYAMPLSAQYEDADILKYELGCTMVRSSHYPPSRHFLDRCDEIGLLVFTELPGWQHIGDDAWKEHALEDLKSLTYTDYNHPSIAIIGTRINESKDDEAFYTKTRNLVKSIDKTRPTGGVRYFGKSQLLEDIYTLNDFSHRGSNQGLAKKKTMTKRSHPYLITEYNGHMFPTKSFDSEPRRVEHALRHFNVLNEAYKQKGIMGALGWCMNDYNTHKEFGSNNKICHHGVNDMNRNSKYAASAYASQRHKPYLNVLSMMHIGDLTHGELKEVLVATNLDAVDVYKNDVFIGRFYPHKRYRYLPHPPVIIDDFIGNQIHDQEKFSNKDASKIKNIILKTLKNELKMSLYHKLQMGFILLKYRLGYEDAVKLYTKYIGGWGEKQKVYRFEGIKDEQSLIHVEKGLNDNYRLNISYDPQPLCIGDTYDVKRIVVEEINELNECAFYSSSTYQIKLDDKLEIIGPTIRVLQGGSDAFWVKTREIGQSNIEIVSDYGVQTLSLTIKKTS